MSSLRDPFAVETLPHFAELRAVARRLTGRRDLADDLVQQTFLRAYAARARYTPGTNARAWLHRILANEVHSAHRREARDRRLGERWLGERATDAPNLLAYSPPVEEAPRGQPPAREPATSVMRAERALSVAAPATEAMGALRALEALPPDARRVVQLVDLDGASYAEAAARLGVPIGTVMSRLHRARRRLRQRLAAADRP